MNERDRIEQTAKMAQNLAGRGTRACDSRVLVIEQLEGGFIVTAQSDYGDRGARQVVPNVDALIGAVNRWHRDGQRAEHD